MAVPSFVRSVATGTTDTFPVPFPYLDKSHVVVSINGVVLASSAYTWPTDGSIKITAGNPAAGSIVERRRSTPEGPIVTFSPGNLDTSDLNVASLQPLYKAHEARDDADDLLSRGWVTALLEAGGEITKGVDGQVAIFDADGNLGPGPDGGDIAGAEGWAQEAKDARDQALSAAALFWSGNRAGIKAIPFPGLVSLTYLKEPGREGWFEAKLTSSMSAGDQAAAAADTREGVFITSGSYTWVRREGWRVAGLSVDWFKEASDTHEQPACNAAASLAATMGINLVRLSAGQTYLLGAALALPTKVRVVSDRAVLSMKPGANLAEMISLGNESGLLGNIIDGGRGANAGGSAFVTIRVGNSNDCLIEGNVIRNSLGFAVAANGGLRATVRKNQIYNFVDFAFAGFGTSARHAHQFEDNYVHTIGWGAVALQNSDYSIVRRNIVVGQIIGGRDARLNVTTTTGGAVTRVSGPSFSSLVVGNFLVIDGGKEYRITAIADGNNLTVDVAGNPLSALTNQPATMGSGDLVGVIGSSHCRVEDNSLANTATFGCGGSLGSTNVQCGNNTFKNNQILNSGKNGINLSASVGLGFLDNNSIVGNKIFNAGYGAGLGTTDADAIFLAGSSPGKLINTQIIGNTVLSFAGSGQTAYWLGTDGQLSFGSVFTSDNKAVAVASTGIRNDVVSIVLSAGWGSTATTSSIVSHGKGVQFNITCSGTGFAATPNFTINKIVDSHDTPSQPHAKIVSNAGGATLVPMWGEQLTTQGSWVAYLGGTPANGYIYTISMKA